jgi:ketosteroid isomerase-like protein
VNSEYILPFDFAQRGPRQDQMLRLAPVAAILLWASAAAQTSPLLEAARQYNAAAKARDAATLASFYADDAMVLPPGEPIIKGRRAIEAAFRESLVSTLETAGTPAASETSGDLGYVMGTWRIMATDRSVRYGNYLEVWKRIGGEWKIILDTWTEDPR